MRCHLVLLAWLGVLLASHCHADLTAAKTSSIVSGLNSGIGLAKTISQMGDKDTALFKKLGKMASFLGAAGGFISMVLVFLPNRDSAELTFMKKQFTLVNTKLDKITSKLDDVQSLITFQNQRSVYIKSSHAILYGHKQLLAFINEVQKTPCPSKSACKRIRARIASRYVKSFNVKKHLDKILRGTFSRTSVFGDPLLSLVSKTSKCNFAKINLFANGVLKLAFKGQQVVLAYGQLMDSRHGITQSMNDWLKNIYRLRSEAYALKSKCFKNMKYQLVKDIQNSDYQIKSPSNAAANIAVKSFLEKKYPWLNVVVFSYQAYGGSVHCNTDVYGGLRNMPKSKNARKRNIIVGVADKKGTYLRQKYDVLHALDGIARLVNFSEQKKDYCKLVRKLKIELKKRSVWKYIASLSIRKNNGGLNIQADNDMKYISKTYSFSYPTTTRVVIVLKSMEQAKGTRCKLACKNDGKCTIYPYSSSQYCQCKPFFQGNLCEKHAQAQFAKTIDSILAATLKLPVLSDVYHDIKKMREYVGVSFANMQKSVTNLELSMKKKFKQLKTDINEKFKWTQLANLYANAVQKIEYYSDEFGRLSKMSKNSKAREKLKKLLQSAIKNHGISVALHKLNKFLVGRTTIWRHKSILLVYMETYSKAGEPCTISYKRKIDHFWKELLLLQQNGYLVWAQALEFENITSSSVSDVYKTRLARQLSAIKKGTCQYDIRHSVNVHCNKHYLHPGMKLRNRCISGYYVHGSLQTSCKRKRSSCRACNCYRYGSASLQCSDISGKCKCKPGFKGTKCRDRDCVWGRWSKFGKCPCGYGKKHARTRTKTVVKLGGGTECKGKAKEMKDCFRGCCRNQFHCSSRSKCIPASYRCDYDNDCGDNQDERSCNERCYTRYTSYNSHGGGKLVYLDRQSISCYGGEYLKMFHMQKSGGSIRYQYICCKLTKNVCTNVMKYNKYTYAVHSTKANYLARQRVSCGTTGFMSSLALRRSPNQKSIRYEYNCCHLNYRHKRQTKCYNRKTSWTYNSSQKSYYLERQTVRCKSRYFLNEFRLHNKYRSWSADSFRYYYRCCRIIP